MFSKIAAAALAGAVLLFAAAPSVAQSKRGPTKCSSILAVCLQRAGGQSSICEDMYQKALAAKQWQATQEPDGTQHAAVPCTK